MMERQNQGTKYLYKKSYCTLNTHSKTCSGASQFLTRSGVLQLKKKLPKTNYYVANGKVKRDLSIATDKCILRGIYKRKLGRFKCSVNTSDVKEVKEPKPDYYSCGDSLTDTHNAKTRLNIDVTSLVVENLKDLLNDWIKNYLLNDETKQKIETVLDSILHKYELQRTPSSYTYTLDIKVDEKHRFNSNNAEVKKVVTRDKESSQTVPVTGKHIKLISTLSIPRNIKRHTDVNSERLKPARRKIRYKNVFLTISRSSIFILNSSSFNLMSISTKSFIKRCATYDSSEIKTSKKHEIVLLPKSSYSESIRNTIQEKIKLDIGSKVYPNTLEVEPLQSLVKSIYADDPANVTSTDKNISRCKLDNYTMTDTDCTLKNVISPYHCHKFNWKKAGDTAEPETFKLRKKRKKTKTSKTLAQGRKVRKAKSKKKEIPSYKCLNKKSMNTSKLYKKSRCSQNENIFLKDLQDILKHIIHYTDSKNIKLDVKINVFPGLGNKIHDVPINEKTKTNIAHDSNLTAAYNVMSTQLLPEAKKDNPILGNSSISSNSSQKSQPKLISILDGAISQSKYVISKEGSHETADKIVRADNEIRKLPNNSAESEIAKDITELRVIIRDLTITTEKFVKEHLEHLKKKPKESEINQKSYKVDNNVNEGGLKIPTISKAIQHPNNKNQIMSGLKLKKEPKKKDIQEFSSRLGKKSISYNVIESESILKVTDMTSVTAEMSTDNVLINKTMNCSLPKSKSLFEVTIGQSKRKLMTYYCDELVKSKQFMQNCKCYSPNAYRYARCPDLNNDFSQFLNENTGHEDIEIAREGHQQRKYDEEDGEISGPHYSCSSVYIDVEDRKKFSIRSRSAMSFWEGLIYCILLWIPVVIIFWLIYVYVIRDIIQPVNSAIGGTVLRSQHSSNSSLFHVKLSDLGF